MNSNSRAAYLLAAAVILTVLTKLGALARDMALAAWFGASIHVDAYFVANVIPGLLWVALYSTITAVFLPMYVTARQRSEDEASRLAVEGVRSYVFLGFCMLFASVLLARPMIELIAPASGAGLTAEAVSLTRIMAIGFVFTAYVGVQNALQQANGRYLWPLAAQPINHLITIGMIYFAAREGSIKLAVAGAVLGWIIQAPLQRWHTRTAYQFTSGFKVRPETLQRLMILSGPIIVGVFLDQANSYIGIAIAAHFSAGAVSHLGFASRLTLFLGNLVSWLTAYFLFPRLASHAARGDDDGAARDLGAGIAIICGLTLPMVVVSVLFGPEMIRLVFARGAFRNADVVATSVIFLPYVLGIVAMGLREILNRVFFSYQRTFAPMVIGVAAALANLGLSVWLSRLYGVPGIAMGASAAALLYVILQVGMLLSWERRLLRVRTLSRFLALLTASALSYVAVDVLLLHLPPMPVITRLFVGSVAVGTVYLALALAFDLVFRLNLWGIVAELKGSSTPIPAVVSPDPELI